MYSKYFTQRLIIAETKGEDFSEDDELIKQKFKKLLDDKHASREHLEQAYLDLIREKINDELYNAYESLNSRTLHEWLGYFRWSCSDGSDVCLYLSNEIAMLLF